VKNTNKGVEGRVKELFCTNENSKIWVEDHACKREV
jgi:hypothetical protein